MNKEYDTIEYYNKNAKHYFEQTIVGDLQENYSRFISKIPKNAYILDFGCGSGRDSKYFLDNGYKVRAIDGSEEMCKLASKYIKQDVEVMKFEELADKNTYDAIWACSSILHVEKEKLPRKIEKMLKALKQNGVIFTCFKKGEDYEIKEGKYYNYINKEGMEIILNNIEPKAEIIDYFETVGSTKRAKSTWVNFILKI